MKFAETWSLEKVLGHHQPEVIQEQCDAARQARNLVHFFEMAETSQKL